MTTFRKKGLSRPVSAGWIPWFILLCIVLLTCTSARATTYYSLGSLDATLTTSWGTTTSGGAHPANFGGTDTFLVQSGHSMMTSQQWTLNSGATLEILNGGTLTATYLVSSLGTFKVDNGGTYVHNAPGSGSNGSTTDFPGSTQTFGSSSTVTFQSWASGGTTPAAIPTGPYGNLTINIASLGGSIQMNGALTTINGSFTVQSTGGQQFQLSATTGYTLTIGGDLNVSGGTLNLLTGIASGNGPANINLGGNFNHSAGTIAWPSSTGSEGSGNFKFTGGAGSVACTMQTTDNPAKLNVIVDPGKTVTMLSHLQTGTSGLRTMTVSGTLLCNGFLVQGSAAFSLSAGATLGITSGFGIATSPTLSGSIQSTSTRTFSTSANYIYNASANQAAGNGLPATVNNLTIANAGGSGANIVTLGQNTTVSGTLTLSRGVLALSTFTLAYGAAGTLAYAGSSAQTATAAEFPGSSGPFNLTINNSSGVSLPANFDRTIGGTLTLTSGTFGVGANTLTLNGPAIAGTPNNLTTTSSSSLSFGGSSTGVNIPGGVTTLNNLTVGNSSGVSLGAAVTLAGQLQINSGTLNLGGFNSTAGSLSFNSGATLQATGTWGYSGQANNDTIHFTSAGGSVNVLYGPGSQFRSAGSGTWNVPATWQVSNDNSIWVASPGAWPGINNSVFIQAGHTVTLVENEACNDLNISSGTTAAGAGGYGQVALGANTLSLSGKLRCYFGAVGGSLPGTSSTIFGTGVPITMTAASAGEIQFVGNTRTILMPGEWSSAYAGGTNTFATEIALNSGQMVMAQTVFKTSALAITSGTFSSAARVGLDNGTTGTGNAMIASGAVWASSSSGITQGTQVLSQGPGTRAGTLTVASGGKLQLSGATPAMDMSAYVLNGTVEYNGSTQTLLQKSGQDASAADIAAYTNLTLSGSGTKTLAVNTTVTSTLTVNAGSTLDFNSHGLTAGASVLNGALTMEVTKTGVNSFTGSQLIQPTGTLAYGGALSVSLLGGTLAGGDSVPLFVAGGFSGYFSSAPTLPSLDAIGGVSWDTNDLATLGYADIYHFSTTNLALSTPVNTTAVVGGTKLQQNHASSSRGTPVLVAVTQPASGAGNASASVSGGALTYTPMNGYSGADSLTGIFQDGHGSQTMTVSVTVGAGTGTSPNFLSAGAVNGNFYANFAGLPGYIYTVEYTDQMPPASGWTKLGNVTATTTGMIQIEDTTGGGNSSRFYRTVWPSYGE